MQRGEVHESSGPPRLSTFSKDVQLLADIRDALHLLIAIETTAPKKTIKTPPPTPRPVPALRRVQDRVDLARLRRIAERITPPPAPD